MSIAQIIAFTGLSGSGKDLAASIWMEDEPCLLFKFAGLLKSVVAAFLMMTPSDLENNKEAENCWGETNRNTLIRVSMAMKELYGEGVWVKSAENIFDLAEDDDHFLVTDLRYPLEYDALKKRGAIVIRINRFGDKGLPLLPKHADHSETIGLTLEHDYVIENFGTIEEFRQKVKDLQTFLKYEPKATDSIPVLEGTFEKLTRPIGQTSTVTSSTYVPTYALASSPACQMCITSSNHVYCTVHNPDEKYADGQPFYF